MILDIQNLGLYVPGRGWLVADVSVRVNVGDRIGIVGRNGCGKSTFLNAIDSGEADAGEVKLTPGNSKLLVRQRLPDADETPHQFLLNDNQTYKAANDGLDELDMESGDESVAAQIEAFGDQIAMIEEQYDAEVPKILHGLGLSEEEQKRPMNQLSGGFQMRIALASALLQRPDVLLLDEPTNHLDLESAAWLRNYLTDYPGAIVMVSHDISFLDAVTRRTWHIIGGGLDEYGVNCTRFLQERETKVAREKKQNAEIDDEVKRIEAYVAKFISKPSRAGGCRSKLKVADRLKDAKATIVEPRPIIPISFPACAAIGDPILELQDAVLGYRDAAVLTGVNLSVQSKSRISVLGFNGQGKTTLIKSLVGCLPTLRGNRRANPRLKIGYYSQEQTDELDVSKTLVEEFLRQVPAFGDEEKVRSHLAAYGFPKEMLVTQVDNLSGGEKSRLIFSIITAQNPNLIILDEPTNHLDIETQTELLKQVKQFPGAVIVVSHDWEFQKSIFDSLDPVPMQQLWSVHDGEVTLYKKPLSRYEKEILTGKRSKAGVRQCHAGAAGTMFPEVKPKGPTKGTAAKRSAAKKPAATRG